MELYLTKRTDGLFSPSYSSDYEAAKKIKPGDTVKAQIKKPRNVEFHRKFFALLNMAFENQETFNNFEHFRAFMTMKAGYYQRIPTDKGEMYLPDSISFAKMDQVEFEELYGAMIDTVGKFLDISREDIMQNLVDFM